MGRQNRWIYEANKDRPLADVLAESRGFFQRLEELLADLPEPVLRESAAIPWLEGRPLGTGFLDGCLEHLYGEHGPRCAPGSSGATRAVNGPPRCWRSTAGGDAERRSTSRSG